MKKYLSIDLDFWNYRSLNECREVFIFLKGIAEKRGLPLKIVDEHHRLISHINAAGSSTIINIDYHSDICNEKGHGDITRLDGRPNVNCGTWANHIKQSLKNEYIWMYPKGIRMKDAECHWPHTSAHSPFLDCARAKWQSVTKEAIPNHRFPFDMCYGLSAIGIAISYEYLSNRNGKEMVKVLMDVFGKKRIPKPFRITT